ncbi:MAG: hypothetical protein ABJC36_11405 [Gemmatimonadales bacterium]
MRTVTNNGLFAVRDFRMWWALFVFFGVLSVLMVRQAYRRWRQGGQVRDGLRFACMAASVVTMTGLVFAALMRAPVELLWGLRALAVAAVGGVVWFSLRR